MTERVGESEFLPLRYELAVFLVIRGAVGASGRGKRILDRPTSSGTVRSSIVALAEEPDSAGDGWTLELGRDGDTDYILVGCRVSRSPASATIAAVAIECPDGSDREVALSHACALVTTAFAGRQLPSVMASGELQGRSVAGMVHALGGNGACLHLATAEGSGWIMPIGGEVRAEWRGLPDGLARESLAEARSGLFLVTGPKG